MPSDRNAGKQSENGRKISSLSLTKCLEIVWISAPSRQKDQIISLRLLQLILATLKSCSTQWILSSIPTLQPYLIMPNSRLYRKKWYYQNTYSAPIVRLFWTTNIFIFFHPFQTISFDPTDIITQTKQSFCCLDVFPTPFLRDGLKTVCPDILAIVNSSISKGIAAHFLKKKKLLSSRFSKNKTK